MELKHAILGLLSIHPMSGYDLGRAFTQSVAHFWHADLSQIYRTLGRLTDDGAIDTETVPQDGKPDRKVHSLTPLGRRQFTDWLESPLEAEQSKEPFLARLFFAEPLGEDAVLQLLDAREAQARELIEALGEIDISGSGLGHELRLASRRHGLHHAKAELEWLGEVRATVEAQR